MLRGAVASGVGAGCCDLATTVVPGCCACASVRATTIAVIDAAARSRQARLAVRRDTPCGMDSSTLVSSDDLESTTDRGDHDGPPRP
jgi:hypothetical protein